MEIKTVERALINALNDKTKDELKGHYENCVYQYLKDNKPSGEIISLVVRGMDIDQGTNFYDCLESMQEKELQELYKTIKGNTEVEKNVSGNGLKFVSGMLVLPITHVGKTMSIFGSLLVLMNTLVYSDKHPIGESACNSIIREFFFDGIIMETVFPKWETIRVRPEAVKAFAETIYRAADIPEDNLFMNIKSWANLGIQFANEKIKKNKIEAKIPESRCTELQALAEHYKIIENQIRNDEYEIARLHDQIESLKAESAILQKEKMELKDQIKHLESDLAVSKADLEKVKQEAAERENINTAFDALKKNDEQALLKDIANELKDLYMDFKDSEKDQMDEILGDIYREKIKSIFTILDKKGIRVE